MDKMNVSQEEQEKIFQEIKRIAKEIEDIDKKIDSLFSSLANWVVNEGNDAPKGRKTRAQRRIWDQIHALGDRKHVLSHDIERLLSGDNYGKLLWFEAEINELSQKIPQQSWEALKRLDVIVAPDAGQQMYIVFPPGSKMRRTQIILPTGKVVKFRCDGKAAFADPYDSLLGWWDFVL